MTQKDALSPIISTEPTTRNPDWLRDNNLRLCIELQLIAGKVIEIRSDPAAPANLDLFYVPKDISILTFIRDGGEVLRTPTGRIMLTTNTGLKQKTFPAGLDVIPDMTMDQYKQEIIKVALEQNFAGRVKQYKEAADGSLHLWLAPEGHTTKSLADTKYDLRQSASDPFMYWYIGLQPDDQLLAPHLIIPNMTYKQFHSLAIDHFDTWKKTQPAESAQ